GGLLLEAAAFGGNGAASALIFLAYHAAITDDGAACQVNLPGNRAFIQAGLVVGKGASFHSFAARSRNVHPKGASLLIQGEIEDLGLARGVGKLASQIGGGGKGAGAGHQQGQGGTCGCWY